MQKRKDVKCAGGCQYFGGHDGHTRVQMRLRAGVAAVQAAPPGECGGKDLVLSAYLLQSAQVYQTFCIQKRKFAKDYSNRF